MLHFQAYDYPLSFCMSRWVEVRCSAMLIDRSIEWRGWRDVWHRFFRTNQHHFPQKTSGAELGLFSGGGMDGGIWGRRVCVCALVERIEWIG